MEENLREYFHGVEAATSLDSCTQKTLGCKDYEFEVMKK